jgi:chromosome partitioning protein
VGECHHIVFANEKGGTGKSTTAVHAAVALAMQGHDVALIDLDSRQKTCARYLENRLATARRRRCDLPTPRFAVCATHDNDGFARQIEEFSDVDYLIVDTPGRDDPLARAAASRADTLVTPLNDSFVDLDLIGTVDPETYRVTRPSFYAEIVWEARKDRARSDGGEVDWVVLRNRLQHIAAKNMRRVQRALDELSRRVGFRVIPGLSEPVIYRELFPSGLTLLDIDQFEEVGLSHIAARQELRDMISGLQLEAFVAAETLEPA